MILKVKELDTRSLILEVVDGRYEISIQGTHVDCLGEKVYPRNINEILESYDSCDYTVKEVVDKLEEIHQVLTK